MNAVIEQRTPQWLDARIGRITGSRIGAVLGHSPWQTRAQLLKEMVAEAMGTRIERDSPAMAWGREHEAEALADFVISSLAETDDLRVGGWHELGGDIGFSPDAWVPGRLLIEIKCPYNRTLSAEPPAHYVDQVQLGMRVLDLHEAALHYWTPDKSVTFWVPRDDAWAETALPRIADFLTEYRAALLDPASWAQDERTDEDWAIAVREYREAKIAAEATAERLERARKTLMELSGGRTSFGLGTKVEWIERQGAVAWAKLAASLHISEEQQDAYRGKSTRYARITTE